MSTVSLVDNDPAVSRPALSRKVLACLGATWLVWGSTYLAIKFALVSCPPFLQLGSRFLTAGVLLAVWMRWRGAAWPNGRQWLNALIVGALMLYLDFINMFLFLLQIFGRRR